MISFNTGMKEAKKRNLAVAILVIIIIGALSVLLLLQTDAEGKTLFDKIVENIIVEEKTIELGDLADINYIGRYASNNSVFDSSYEDVENKLNDTPLKVFISKNKSELPPTGYEGYSSDIIDGLLEGLIGLKEGVTTTIGPIPPSKAYGNNKLEIGDSFETGNLAMILNKTVEVTNHTGSAIELKWINIENFGKFSMPQLILKDLTSMDPSKMVIYPPPYYLWENSTEIIDITNETVTVFTSPTKSENISGNITGIQYEEEAMFIFPDATTAEWDNTTITLTSSPKIGDEYVLFQESPYGSINLTFTVENVTDDKINVSFVYEEDKTYQESIRTITFNRTFEMPRMYSIPMMYIYLLEEDIEKGGYSLHELAGEELIFEVTVEDIYKPS
jgi:FKBP-type peptidyl-prolyl cis-trans isomerase 2